MGLRPGVLLAALNLGMGLVLMLGGPGRTSAPAFRAATEIMPIDAWGGLFLIGGFVCALASRIGRAGAVAVSVGAGIHAFWAVALWQSATSDPNAALTGVWVYSWLSVLHVHTGIRLARAVT